MKNILFVLQHPFLRFGVLFLVAFSARLCYGLSGLFWGTDEKQIYLLGLKYYSTGDFPYYGPDVVYTQTQLPGALQALLIGGPFHLLPIPEAPFILLNLLSTVSLIAFAYYLSQRISMRSGWLIYLWLLTAPWTLNYSTHIVNPSYVLPAAILFFIGVFEILIFREKQGIPPKWSFFLMGFGLLWVMQLHLSFVLLLPFTLACFIRSNIPFRSFSPMLKNMGYFLLGATITGSLLLPTYLQYGIGGTGGTEANIHLQWKHLDQLFTIISRLFAFASFEFSTFIGYNLNSRLQFLGDYPWFTPFVLMLLLSGFLQIAHLFVSLFYNPVWQTAEGRRIRRFIFCTIGLLYFSFLFSIKGPSPHTFYVLLPVSMLYAFSSWQHLLDKPFWKKIATAILLIGIVFHLHLAHSNFRHHSLYKNRNIPQKAIEQKNSKILGNRRSEDWGCCY